MSSFCLETYCRRCGTLADSAERRFAFYWYFWGYWVSYRPGRGCMHEHRTRLLQTNITRLVLLACFTMLQLLHAKAVAQGGFMARAISFVSAGTIGSAEACKFVERQDAEQCRYFANEGNWNDNFDKWTSVPASEGENDALAAFFRPDASQTSHQQHLRHVLLCGDSTFYWLALAHQTGKMKRLKSSARCDMMEYLGLPRAKEWIRPNTTIEGPKDYGFENPFCTDCAGCNSQMHVAVRNDKLLERSYEYIAVEFARDREFQTDQTGTTQETLALYLGETFDRDLCILGSGVHDVALNITSDDYATNVVHYIELVKPFCKKIIWLLISASLNDSKFPQEHSRLHEFNKKVVGKCKELGPHVLLFDIWQMSLPAPLHGDNVHHTVPYYQALSGLLLSRTGLYGG